MADPPLAAVSADTVARFAPKLAPLAAALRIVATRAPGFSPGTDLVDADLAAALAGRAVDGWVAVTSDVHRRQHRNLAAAFEELATLVLGR